jgi:transcriptional regulator with XRE-family HTH domain
MMTTGSKIQNLRKTQNITQEQLADYLGVSRQSVSKWESNMAYPETDKMIKMGALFRVSLDFLLREDYETVEQLAKKNDLAKLNTDALVFALISVFGYLLGVSLVYITLKPLIGFVVLIGLIFVSAILYIFRRSRFLLHSEFSDSDQQAIIKNTRTLYSIDLIVFFLFLPLVIFYQFSLVDWVGPFAPTTVDVLSFSSYFWLAIPFGVLGVFSALIVRYIHGKTLLRTQSDEKLSPILICDAITSTIVFLLFFLLFLAIPGKIDYYIALISLLFIPYLFILPVFFLRKRMINLSLSVALFVSGLVFVVSFVVFQSGFFELGIILSTLNVVFLLGMTLKPMIRANKTREINQSFLIKNALLTVLLAVTMNLFSFLYYNNRSSNHFQTTTEINNTEIIFLFFLSFLMIIGFYFCDRLIIKNAAKKELKQQQPEIV